jgi:hypothetical protein
METEKKYPYLDEKKENIIFGDEDTGIDLEERIIPVKFFFDEVEDLEGKCIHRSFRNVFTRKDYSIVVELWIQIDYMEMQIWQLKPDYKAYSELGSLKRPWELLNTANILEKMIQVCHCAGLGLPTIEFRFFNPRTNKKIGVSGDLEHFDSGYEPDHFPNYAKWEEDN